MRIVTALLALLILGACASKPSGPRPQVIDRILSNAPGEAQPSKVVAAEIAFARAAREQGQYTAAALYAAPGAIYHTDSGLVSASTFLQTVGADPQNSVAWTPKIVVISCDAALAVSQGRYLAPDGEVGNYVTVWRRQPDREYRWIYSVSGPDVPQPIKLHIEEPEEGSIVVTAMDAVLGLISDCSGPSLEASTASVMSEGWDIEQGNEFSPDRSLRWSWAHSVSGRKDITADYLSQGEWQTAIKETFTSQTSQ